MKSLRIKYIDLALDYASENQVIHREMQLPIHDKQHSNIICAEFNRFKRLIDGCFSLSRMHTEVKCD